jgi:HPt (histidine-containing phosphotransfer) domain-containing protein
METKPSTQTDDARAIDDWSLGILRELMALFIQQTPERLRALRESCLSGNSARTVTGADRLRGSAESLGLKRFASLSATVARQAARGDIHLASRSVGDLEREFARASHLLTTALEWN